MSAEVTQAEADFVERHLGLAPGSRIVDVPCGSGRHSLSLASHGHHVAGVDISLEANRINWNLGIDYDSNQYGRPVGDGKIPRGGWLRLDRRGPYFAAYYRNEVEVPDWVCVGVVCNDSLNPVVYLRCAGKRWRQEDDKSPVEFLPIVPNHIIFKNLIIQRFR